MVFALYIAFTALASLNRETALVLVACYWAVYGLSQWRRLLVLVAVYVGITGGLHLILGPAPHMLGLEGTLHYNVDNLGDALFVNVTLVPLWIALVRGYRYAPDGLRRCAGAGVVYLVAIVVAAAWNEMLRLALPALVLVLPVILSEGKRGNTYPSTTTANR